MLRSLSREELFFVVGGKYVSVGDYNVQGATTQDLNNIERSLVYLQNSSIASQTLNADLGATINVIHDGNDSSIYSSNTINYDPNSALTLENGDMQSSSLGLLHEFGHLTTPGGQDNSANSQYGTNADANVIKNVENPAAAQLGEPQRADHGGDPTVISDPTASTDSTGNTPDTGGNYSYWGDDSYAPYYEGGGGGGGGATWKNEVSHVSEVRTGYVKEAAAANYTGGGHGHPTP